MKTSRDQIHRENVALAAVVRNNRMFLFLLAAANVLIWLVLALLIYAQTARFPATAFLATTDAQAVCAPIGLDEPLVSEATARDYAVTAIRAIQTYDWTSWKDQINSSTSQYLTPEGRAKYRISVSEWGIIKDVVANFQNATSVQREPAIVLQQGVLGDRYTWQVNVPMTLIYRNAKDRRSENRDFLAIVVRTPKSPLNPKGIAIGSLISAQPVVAPVGGEQSSSSPTTPSSSQASSRPRPSEGAQ